MTQDYINEPFENSYQEITSNYEMRKNRLRNNKNIFNKEVKDLNNIETRLLKLGLI